MMPENSNDFLVHEHLQSLGVSLLIEWDVLAFLYRHGSSLTSAPHIARLLGYNRAAVSTALDRLASLGLIHRSRSSQGIRLFRFSPADTSMKASLVDLMNLAEKRPGRLVLLKYLHRGTPRPPVRAGGLRLAGKET